MSKQKVVIGIVGVLEHNFSIGLHPVEDFRSCQLSSRMISSSA